MEPSPPNLFTLRQNIGPTPQRAGDGSPLVHCASFDQLQYSFWFGIALWLRCSSGAPEFSRSGLTTRM